MKRVWRTYVFGLCSLVQCVHPGSRAYHRLVQSKKQTNSVGAMHLPSCVQGSPVHATRAYLTIHPQVARFYAAKIAHNESLFTELVAREFELQNTHTVVYHAHAKFLCVYQDFLKKVYEWEYGVRVPDSFVFVRWWHDSSNYNDVQSFLDTEFKKFLDDHYKGSLEAYKKADNYHARFDHSACIKHQILSVNVALFGGCVFKKGEDTLSYFWNNKSFSLAAGSALDSLLQPLIDKYGFKPELIKDLISLSALLHEEKDDRSDDVSTMPPQGVLMQICVPKKQIDEVVYISGPCGNPHIFSHEGKIVAVQDFSSIKQRYIKSLGVLESYVQCPNNCVTLKKDVLQARLLLNNRVVLNPWSGITIIRSMPSVSDRSFARYNNELERIAAALCAQAAKPHQLRIQTSLQPNSPQVDRINNDYEKQAQALFTASVQAVALSVQQAIARGDVPKLSHFIEQGFDINRECLSGDGFYKNLLEYACSFNKRNVVIWLIDKGINKEHRQRAFNYACRVGNLDYARLIYMPGITLSCQELRALIYKNAKQDCDDLIEVLLKNASWSPEELEQVLQGVSLENNVSLSTVKVLVRRGARFSAIKYDYLVHKAYEKGCKDWIDFLGEYAACKGNNESH